MVFIYGYGIIYLSVPCIPTIEKFSFNSQTSFQISAPGTFFFLPQITSVSQMVSIHRLCRKPKGSVGKKWLAVCKAPWLSLCERSRVQYSHEPHKISWCDLSCVLSSAKNICASTHKNNIFINTNISDTSSSFVYWCFYICTPVGPAGTTSSEI